MRCGKRSGKPCQRAPHLQTAVIVLANVGGDTAPRLNREIRTVMVGSLP